MKPARQPAIGDAAPCGPLTGDFSALLQRLGRPGSGGVLDHSLAPELAGRYVREILAPVELPAAVAAFEHARRGEARELIELDRHLGGEARLQPFAAALKAAGARQLDRLKPLRDERVLQRYAEALAASRAFGWHPVVFGLNLAIYRLPLRQGLLQYAQGAVAGILGPGADPIVSSLAPVFQSAVASAIAESSGPAVGPIGIKIAG